MQVPQTLENMQDAIAKMQRLKGHASNAEREHKADPQHKGKRTLLEGQTQQLQDHAEHLQRQFNTTDSYALAYVSRLRKVLAGET